jgi:hypothetical protein
LLWTANKPRVRGQSAKHEKRQAGGSRCWGRSHSLKLLVHPGESQVIIAVLGPSQVYRWNWGEFRVVMTDNIYRPQEPYLLFSISQMRQFLDLAVTMVMELELLFLTTLAVKPFVQWLTNRNSRRHLECGLLSLSRA